MRAPVAHNPRQPIRPDPVQFRGHRGGVIRHAPRADPLPPRPHERDRFDFFVLVIFLHLGGRTAVVVRTVESRLGLRVSPSCL